jgi:hypothetical protein
MDSAYRTLPVTAGQAYLESPEDTLNGLEVGGATSDPGSALGLCYRNLDRSPFSMRRLVGNPRCFRRTHVPGAPDVEKASTTRAGQPPVANLYEPCEA